MCKWGISVVRFNIGIVFLRFYGWYWRLVVSIDEFLDFRFETRIGLGFGVKYVSIDGRGKGKKLDIVYIENCW